MWAELSGDRPPSKKVLTPVAEIAPAPLNKGMNHNKIIDKHTCWLCGDHENDIYTCETSGVRACGCCVGLCEGCGDLICAGCADPGPPLDPGCPRCIVAGSADRSSMFCVNASPGVPTDPLTAIL